MRMHSQELSEAGEPGEKVEAMDLGTQEASNSNFSSKQKYRELKNRLKYLIYEHTCFESEMCRGEGRLLEIARDKTVLLDQLLQYEPLSEDEEEATDYSSSEDENIERKLPKGIKEIEGSPRSIKSGGPQASPSTVRVPKPNDLTRQGIARATAILNSVSTSSTTTPVLPATPTSAPPKSAKAGTKRQSKLLGKTSTGGTASKISKTVSRVRQANTVHLPPQQQDLSPQTNAVSKLVVSFPITSISTEVTPPPPPLSSTTTLTTLTVSSSSSSSAALHPVSAAPKTLPSQVTSTSLSLVTSSSTLGAVHVTTLPTVTTTASSSSSVPAHIPVLGIKKMRRGPSSTTSSSGSSSSSSGSESGESGSDTSSSTEGEEDMEVTGPVQLVSTVKASSDLPRPKAILSPVKPTPPLLTRGTATSPASGSPLVSPAMLVSPRQVQAPAAFNSWVQSPPNNGDGGGRDGSPASLGNVDSAGFHPLAPPLSSPSSSLPFSSLSKSGGGGGAFQVVSPKQQQVTVMTSGTPHATENSGGSPATGSTSVVSNQWQGTLSNSSHS